MVRRWIRRFGAFRITAAVTLFSVAGAVGLGAILDLTIKKQILRFDLSIAAVIAAILAPLVTVPFIRLSHQLDRTEEEMRRIASLDSLTQTFARGHFLLLAEREILRSRRYSHPLSLLLLDIDHFKAVNDRCGHSMGDRVLRAAATRIGQQLRGSDMLGRYGGEEFTILLPETGIEGARIVAERIRSAVRGERLTVGTTGVEMTVSIGVTELRPEMEDIDAVLAHADAALYRAKDRGRDRIEFA
jgi:diguanylate cyclase (GGDEF)-like protein